MCGHEGCPFRVIDTGYGNWYHVDTHGIPTDHKAIPTEVREVNGL